MTQTTTHQIPIELAAHAAWTDAQHAARRAVRIAKAMVVGSLAWLLLLLLVSHYGNHNTANEGYTLGTDHAYVGLETRGDVGPYAQVSTALGTLNWFPNDDGLSWCPAGATDVECGA